MGQKKNTRYYLQYRQLPEVKAKARELANFRQREYNRRPEVKERRKQYSKRPEIKARIAAYAKGYNQRPEVIERNKERSKIYQRRYRARPDVKEREKYGDLDKIYRKAREIGLSEPVARAYTYDGVNLTPFKLGGKK